MKWFTTRPRGPMRLHAYDRAPRRRAAQGLEAVVKCPIDQETLVITERQGIEIDYCPRCRGVWLDRGELDKLIDRGDRYESGPPGPPRDDRAFVSGMPRRDHDDDDDDDYRRRYGQGHKRKKKGFLSEMFEFD